MLVAAATGLARAPSAAARPPLARGLARGVARERPWAPGGIAHPRQTVGPQRQQQARALSDAKAADRAANLEALRKEFREVGGSWGKSSDKLTLDAPGRAKSAAKTPTVVAASKTPKKPKKPRKKKRTSKATSPAAAADTKTLPPEVTASSAASPAASSTALAKPSSGPQQTYRAAPPTLSTSPNAVFFEGKLTSVYFQNEEALYGEFELLDGQRRIRFKAKKQAPAKVALEETVALQGLWRDHKTFGMQLDGTVVSDADQLATLRGASDAGSGGATSLPAYESDTEQAPAWFPADLSPSTFSSEGTQRMVQTILQRKVHAPRGPSGPVKVTHEALLAKAIEMMEAGRFKNIGEALAQRMQGALGAQLLDALEDKIQGGKTIADAVSGVSQIGGEKLVSVWTQTRSFRLAEFLATHQMPYMDFARIFRRYEKAKDPEGNKKDAKESELMDRFRENPYLLVADELVHFNAVDPLAPRTRKLAKSRELAAVLQVVRDGTRALGHSCLPQDIVELGVVHLLGEKPSPQVYEPAYVANGHFQISTPTCEGKVYVYDGEVMKSEKEIVSYLKKIQSTPRGCPKDDSLHDKIEPPQHGLSDIQATCVDTLLEAKVAVLTGYAGTGKTYLLREVARRLHESGRSVFVAAPTGRAAQRLRHSTDLPATTLHRLLGADWEKNDMFDRASGKLKWDTIIVDEASMLDLFLLNWLLKSVRTTSSLIFVGDPAQLQSVGQGNVLADLIRIPSIPTCALTEIFRQRGEENEILLNATAVRKGAQPPMLRTPFSPAAFAAQAARALQESRANPQLRSVAASEASGKVIYIECPQGDAKKLIETSVVDFVQAQGFDPLEEMQVISPRRKGPASVEELNPVMQTRLNEAAAKENEKAAVFGFYPGDKVMQVVNCYKKDVYNGNIGLVLDLKKEPKEKPEGEESKYDVLQVGFSELNDFRDVSKENRSTANYDSATAAAELELAYATTVHKAQGSQFPVVVLPIFPEQGRFALNRNLLYTALTRATHYVIVLGDSALIRRAVKSTSHERFSLLPTYFADDEKRPGPKP